MASAGYAQNEIFIDFYFPSASAKDAEGIFQSWVEDFQEEYEGASCIPSSPAAAPTRAI